MILFFKKIAFTEKSLNKKIQKELDSFSGGEFDTIRQEKKYIFGFIPVYSANVSLRTRGQNRKIKKIC